MQVRCIKPFGGTDMGEIVGGLPDGAAVDPEHWEVIPQREEAVPPGVPAAGYEPPGALPPPLTGPPPALPLPSAAAVTPKEM